MNIFVFGSSLLSSYWNGAATYYRGIYRALHDIGYSVTFAEPDAFSRQQHLDPGDYSYAKSIVYQPTIELEHMLALAAKADVVIKHSGIGVDDELLENEVLQCQQDSLVLFWDVDAPDTIARLLERPGESLSKAVPRYDAVFTYGGGPVIERAYRSLGARQYYSVYNGLDSKTHFPVAPDPALSCDVVFLGNRLPDREQRVDDLFLEAARRSPEMRFLLGGEGWSDKNLPKNVRWIGHVPTGEHNRVNCSARMVMNINRSSMASYGYSPPTRVFEVAGSGSCLLCDDWPGMAEFFVPGEEVLIVKNADDVVTALRTKDKQQAKAVGEALRKRALRDHTYAARAELVDQHLRFLREQIVHTGAAK